MFEKHFIFEDKNNIDMNVIECGRQDCKPDFSYGPAIRDYYIIHYITKGRGVFRYGGEIYNLKKGEGYLIQPNELAYYQADRESPWSYSWVCFNGAKVKHFLKLANLNRENPIFQYDNINDINQIILSMMSIAQQKFMVNEAEVLGYFYMLLGKLVEVSKWHECCRNKSHDREEYIEKAIQYIHMHYSSDIKVSDVASFIGLNQNYLGTIFKKYTNLSPQEYIIQYRIQKAMNLMRNMVLSIGDIARSVGYKDQLVFSKTFKKVIGKSPREYRNTI